MPADFDAEKMLEMFRTAKSVAASLNGAESDAGFDYESMLKAVQIFKTLQAGESGTAPPNGETPDDITRQTRSALKIDGNFLDSRLQTPELMAIKAAIPYLEHKYQKNLAIFVKLIEIRRLLDICTEMAGTLRGADASMRRENLIMFARPLVRTQNRYMLDVLGKFLEIEKIMEKSRGNNYGRL